MQERCRGTLHSQYMYVFKVYTVYY